MPGSVVLDTAIGLVFVFLVTSLAATGMVEYIAKLLDKRGEYLLRGLREMLDVPPSAPSGEPGNVPGEDTGLLATRARLGGRRRSATTRSALQDLSEQGADLGKQLVDPQVDSTSPKAPLADLLLAHPVVAALHRPTKPGVRPAGAQKDKVPRSRRDDMRLASYLSSRTFVTALLDLLVPDEAGITTMTQVTDSLAKLPTGCRAETRSWPWRDRRTAS